MQLQKGPIGLLGAFALKVLGRNPPAFGDSVVPIVDVYDQYLNQGEQQVKSSAVALNIGVPFLNVTFTVPTSKCWRVLGAGGFVSLNAADAALIAQVGIGILSPADPLNSALVFAQYPPQLGANGRTIGTSFRPPLFLTAGWQVSFGFTFSGNITAAGSATGTLLVQEFDQ